MSDRTKIHRIGRDAIIYDPDGLSIEIGTEFLEAPSGQSGIRIYDGSARYTKGGKPVEKEIMQSIRADLLKEYDKEGMYVRFDGSNG